MATQHRQSAKIYQFPPRASAVFGGTRQGGTAVPADHPSTRLPEIDVGSAWYHDAAIQEANRTRKP